MVSQFRLNSGGSGYDIDSAIKVGKINSSEDFIEELKHGLRLRGADNDGECTEVDGSIEDALDFFYEDPLLSFTDSTLYGCHKDLSLTDLQAFCDGKKYQEMMLFQNMLSFNRLGKFGVSDPNSLEDWVEVDQTEASPTEDAV